MHTIYGTKRKFDEGNEDPRRIWASWSSRGSSQVKHGYSTRPCISHTPGAPLCALKVIVWNFRLVIPTTRWLRLDGNAGPLTWTWMVSHYSTSVYGLLGYKSGLSDRIEFADRIEFFCPDRIESNVYRIKSKIRFSIRFDSIKAQRKRPKHFVWATSSTLSLVRLNAQKRKLSEDAIEPSVIFPLHSTYCSLNPLIESNCILIESKSNRIEWYLVPSLSKSNRIPFDLTALLQVYNKTRKTHDEVDVRHQPFGAELLLGQPYLIRHRVEDVRALVINVHRVPAVGQFPYQNARKQTY